MPRATVVTLILFISPVGALRIAPTFSRRRFLCALGAGPAWLSAIPIANAKYGEFAKTSGGPSFSVGDANNECLFAQPGSGICTVYKSSQPPIWASPNTDLALAKLLKAVAALNEVGVLIEGTKWTQIIQTLGSSRDLREAVGFLTSAAADPAAAAIAKKVFASLDGVQVAAMKKDRDTALKFYTKYETEVAKLLALLG